jgi:phospholipid transport system transporter-binding protein
MHIEGDSSRTLLCLRGSLNITAAEKIQAELLSYLAGGKPEAVDLSSVDACDAAGMQIVLALEKSMAQAGKSFRIVAASDAFLHTADSLGVDFGDVLCAPLNESGSKTKEVENAQ